VGNPIRCVTTNAVSPIKETADALHARSCACWAQALHSFSSSGRLAEGEMAKPRLFDKLDHFKRTPDIIRLYESGEKIEYIGALVGLHPSNVRKIAQRYGAAVRKRGRPKRRR
jgi:hypothetical protein